MAQDGTKEREDALPEKGQPSTETTNPSGNPKSYTEEEVNERHSKLDKQISLLAKERDTFKASHEALSIQVEELLRRQEEAEEAAVMDNPEELNALRERRRKEADDKTKDAQLAEREVKAKEKEAALAARETELSDIVKQHETLKRTELAAEVAIEKGVSMDAILKLAKDNTREAYLEVADVLPKVKEPINILPHSGRKNTGAIDLNSLTPREKIRLAYSKNK